MTESVEQQAHAALVRVVERITPPEQWTKGADARSKRGRKCRPTYSGAVCWCLEGARRRETVYLDLPYTASVMVIDSLQDASRELYDDSSYLAINDEKGHAAALAVAQRAAALAAERAGDFS